MLDQKLAVEGRAGLFLYSLSGGFESPAIDNEQPEHGGGQWAIFGPIIDREFEANAKQKLAEVNEDRRNKLPFGPRADDRIRDLQELLATHHRQRGEARGGDFAAFVQKVKEREDFKPLAGRPWAANHHHLSILVAIRLIAPNCSSRYPASLVARCRNDLARCISLGRKFLRDKNFETIFLSNERVKAEARRANGKPSLGDRATAFCRSMLKDATPRVPELVLAAILGLNPARRGPSPGPPGKHWLNEGRKIIRCCVAVGVRTARAGIRRLFWGLSTSDDLPEAMAEDVLRRMLPPRRCRCWQGSGSARRRGASRIKQETCDRHHNLANWNPFESTIFQFVRRAALGTFQSTRFQPNSLPSSMLRKNFAKGGLRNQRLVAHYHCDTEHCCFYERGQWVNSEKCEAGEKGCGKPVVRTTVKRRLTLKDYFKKVQVKVTLKDGTLVTKHAYVYNGPRNLKMVDLAEHHGAGSQGKQLSGAGASAGFAERVSRKNVLDAKLRRGRARKEKAGKPAIPVTGEFVEALGRARDSLDAGVARQMLEAILVVRENTVVLGNITHMIEHFEPEILSDAWAQVEARLDDLPVLRRVYEQLKGTAPKGGRTP